MKRIYSNKCRNESVKIVQNDKTPAANSLTAWLRKFIRRTGLPPSSVHSLRHTYASLLLAERTPLVVVAHNLGHAQASTTANIYAHTIQSAEVAAAGMTVSAYVKSKF